ncbi:MAG: ABC transporter permease [Candidatus Saccharimonadales bacterium]
MKLSNIFSRRNRILLRELVGTDFKLRYQGSALGYMWSILKPLFMFGVLYLVFAVILNIGKGIEHYPVYLLAGVILWNFFAESTNQGKNAIVSRGDLIRKISFPRYIIVISGTISALINLFINLAVLAVFAIINGVEFTPLIFLAPLILIEVYILSLSVAFFLAAANVKLRDIGHIWEIIMQAAFYGTPIIYPLNQVVEKSEFLAKFLLINPMAQIIQDFRYLTVNSKQTLTVFNTFDSVIYQAVPFILVILIATGAGLFFKARSKTFAEDL